MQQKLETRAFDQVASVLQPGEQPIAAARALVGKFSASRFGTALKQSLIMEGGGALLSTVLTKTSKQFVVVTDRRVLFLTQTFLGGPGKRIIGELPRNQVTLAESKFATMSVLRLAFGDQEGDGISLTFPRVDKKNAESLAAALQHTPVA
ncbi:hypothetical protein [Winogradskya humida]|uniref:PH (Pleckstrin Homology) domain-containing protein n=1 Tax=Winogradskya humida TaxID=113566 RepID=A0ABQ4A221_9ACTN|nr:hypothetical protein [Actinoplanes humidus]GIE24759.1 hypothetical protein Ahu01nite_078610 [Actinoplanes humidus]